MYMYTTKYTLKWEQKKPTKHIVNFRYTSEVSDVYLEQNTLWVRTINSYKIYRKFLIYIESFWYVYGTKYTLSWNKKRLQTMSEIFDMVHVSQVENLAEVSHDFRDITPWAKKWRKTWRKRWPQACQRCQVCQSFHNSKTLLTCSRSPLRSRRQVFRHFFCSRDCVTKVMWYLC